VQLLAADAIGLRIVLSHSSNTRVNRLGKSPIPDRAYVLRTPWMKPPSVDHQQRRLRRV